MKLSELLSADVIKVDLESTEKVEVFHELIEVLYRAGRVADRDAALKAILDREAMATTGIGSGIAVPHGKTPAIDALTVALGISEQGIDYDATDGEPVYVVFLVLAQVSNPGPHVQCLGEIARLLMVPGFCDRLRRATGPQEALDLIRAEE